MEKLLYDEDCCTCNLKWHCVPHNACFIHDLCFYEGSSSFPSVKPPCPSWSDFSYNWYCELASHLELHPHSPLPHFGSEVEYLPLVMPYYHILPPANWLLSLQYLPGLLLGNGNCSYPLLFSSSYCLSYCHYCLAASPCITIIVLHSLKCRLLSLLSQQLTVPSLYGTISSLCSSVGLAK